MRAVREDPSGAGTPLCWPPAAAAAGKGHVPSQGSHKPKAALLPPAPRVRAACDVLALPDPKDPSSEGTDMGSIIAGALSEIFEGAAAPLLLHFCRPVWGRPAAPVPGWCPGTARAPAAEPQPRHHASELCRCGTP